MWEWREEEEGKSEVLGAFEKPAEKWGPCNMLLEEEHTHKMTPPIHCNFLFMCLVVLLLYCFLQHLFMMALQTVLTACLDMVVENIAIWTMTEGRQAIVLPSPNLPTTPPRQLCFRWWGVICYLFPSLILSIGPVPFYITKKNHLKLTIFRWSVSYGFHQTLSSMEKSKMRPPNGAIFSFVPA